MGLGLVSMLYGSKHVLKSKPQSVRIPVYDIVPEQVSVPLEPALQPHSTAPRMEFGDHILLAYNHGKAAATIAANYMKEEINSALDLAEYHYSRRVEYAMRARRTFKESKTSLESSRAFNAIKNRTASYRSMLVPKPI